MSLTRKFNKTMKANVKENNSPKAAPKDGVDLKDLKNFDIKKAVSTDLNAAIHFLAVIRDNPEILDLVTGQLQILLENQIKLKESQPELPLA